MPDRASTPPRFKRRPHRHCKQCSTNSDHRRLHASSPYISWKPTTVYRLKSLHTASLQVPTRLLWMRAAHQQALHTRCHQRAGAPVTSNHYTQSLHTTTLQVPTPLPWMWAASPAGTPHPLLSEGRSTSHKGSSLSKFAGAYTTALDEGGPTSRHTTHGAIRGLERQSRHMNLFHDDVWMPAMLQFFLVVEDVRARTRFLQVCVSSCVWKGGLHVRAWDLSDLLDWRCFISATPNVLTQECHQNAVLHFLAH